MSLHPEDMIMFNYDFSPFYRSTIGFDRLLGLLDKTAGLEASAPSYPPYNIERTGENAYRMRSPASPTTNCRSRRAKAS